MVLLHWLRQGYDIREVNPQISKRLRECFTESHIDISDAQGLAWSVRFHSHLPKVRLTVITASWKRLSRLRARLVKAQTGLYNRLHSLLAESYGAVYKSKKALEFFQAFPTLDDALNDLPRVRSLLGEEKAALLEGAGRWGEDLYLETLRLEIRLTIQLLFAHRAAIKGVEVKMAELSRPVREPRCLCCLLWPYSRRMAIRKKPGLCQAQTPLQSAVEASVPPAGVDPIASEPRIPGPL